MLESFKAKVLRASIKWAMRRPAGDRIPLSGPRAESVDGYTVELRNDDAPYQMLVDSIDSSGVQGRFWSGEAYDRVGSIDNEELSKSKPIIVHYIKTYSFRYENSLKFITMEYTFFPYVYMFLDKFRQRIFNIKPLMMKSRYDLLKWMIKCHVEQSIEEFSEFQIMKDLYSK